MRNPSPFSTAALFVLSVGLAAAVASPPAHEGDIPAKPPTGRTQAAKPEPAARPASRPAAQPARDDDSGASTPEPVADAEQALRLLREGNERWVKDSASGPSTSPAQRASTAEHGQKPFATILTCADSRLPVERIFDRGVGELFVVRVAGNVAGPSEAGTVEYGVGHLHTPLLVVMGHTRCGAVAAAVSGAKVHGAVKGLIDSIAPAVERARRSNPGADEATLTAEAIRENVWQTIYELCESSADVRTRLRSGELRVLGAVCDVSTGRVQWLGEHPWQGELLDALEARSARQAEAGADDGDGH